METNLIIEKCFRPTETMKKVEFILQNSGVRWETIQKAAVVARKNPFHNFDHEVGVAEASIRLALAEEKSISEINLVALASLFHDAGHKGVAQFGDEMVSANITDTVLVDFDTQILGITRNVAVSKIRDLILATTMSVRGKSKDSLSCIIQDADLAHLGQGPVYWAWAAMGLLDEFNLNLKDSMSLEAFFKDDYRNFINYLNSISGTGWAYLSSGAKNVFKDPADNYILLDTLSRSSYNTDYSYAMRIEDINFSDFSTRFPIG